MSRPPIRATFLATYWPALLGWLLVVIAPMLVILRSRPEDVRPIAVVNGSSISGRRFVVTYYGLVGIATLLTLVWVVSQRDQLFAFNSFFINGLLFVAALPVAFVVSRSGSLRSRPARDRHHRRLALGGPHAAVAIYEREYARGRARRPDGPRVERCRGPIGDPAGPILQSDPSTIRTSEWPTVVGLALALERHGITYLVPPEWGFMFGYDHVYPGSPLVRPSDVPVEWRLAAPGPTTPGLIPLSTRLVVESIGPAVPGP